MKPLVSIVILALNEEKNLPKCLAAVFKQKVGFEYEVIVVDSGSEDRTKEVAHEFAKKYPLRLMEVAPAEFSHGKTRTLAAEQSDSEYLVCLVADAEPANDQWLAKLVEAAEADESIAGSYSRQIARPKASVMEKLRLSKRIASKSEPRISSLRYNEEYWLFDPIERIFICDFDDVSSLRKRSVLEQIPIPDCAWAEDLAWSKACLTQGYKIAFAPESIVRHSHRLSSGYLFRRGWIDQKAAAEHFGLVYYPDFLSALRGFIAGTRDEVAEIMDAQASLIRRLASACRAPAVNGFEIAGRYLSEIPPGAESFLDLAENLSSAEIHPKNAMERVAKTGFAVGDRWRKAILANPPAVINFEMDVADECEFRFGVGIKPEAFRHRKLPIDFSVAVDEEEVFKQEHEINLENLKSWKDASIDLGKWLGRKIKLSLVTDAQDMNYGWAAWAEPRIVFKNRTPGFELKRYLARKAEKAVSGNFRHN
jgi:rhamnosyltransferase